MTGDDTPSRAHPRCHGPSGHVCQEPSGRTCHESGCNLPAGTWWGPFWCPDHDVERLDRLSAYLDAVAAPEPTTYDVMGTAPCPGFAWMHLGQPLAHCGTCGCPYWHHSHVWRERGKRRLRRSISREEARAVERKWA